MPQTNRIAGNDEQQPLLSQANSQYGNDYSSNNLSGSHSQAAQESSDHFMQDHKHLLHEALYPKDAFDGDVYWADLPADEQARWVKREAEKEARREIEKISQLAKVGFFEPVRAYCRTYAVAGVGFFVEGYVLFSVGNMMPMFKAVWPQCWADEQVCDARTITAIKYMEIAGIICGQVAVGYLGDAIGRRWGLIQDAAIMLLGTLLLTAMWGTSLQGWTVMYTVAIFVFGLGVGGEYPMTSTTSIEGMKGAQDRGHRGRSACLAFLMQGWGQLANQLVLILLAIATSPSTSLKPPYTEHQVQITFRLTFAVSALCLIYFLYLRIFRLKRVDDGITENRHAKHQDTGSGSGSGYDWQDLQFVLSRFWARLLATSGCWFCSDFAFYGMQIFRNDLLELVTGTSPHEVDTVWLYNLINIACQLVGYYLAALLIDYKPYGRRRMQAVGFFALLAIYTTIAACFPLLNRPGAGAKCFQTLFFLANFWVQFGPNSTTFLVAAEVYPVGVRSTAHGFSAASGKVGALAATLAFGYIGERTKFVLAALATLVGLALTLFFVPDTTGLDLTEMQRAWSFVTEGRAAEYHGIAVHRHHLSWFETLVRRRDKPYDIDEDRSQRVDELRRLFEKKGGECVAEADNEGEAIDRNLVRYFELERSERNHT